MFTGVPGDSSCCRCKGKGEREQENTRTREQEGNISNNNFANYGHNSIDATTLLQYCRCGGRDGRSEACTSIHPLRLESKADLPASAGHLHHRAALCCSATSPSCSPAILFTFTQSGNIVLCTGDTGDTGATGEWATGFKCQPFLSPNQTSRLFCLF